MAEMIAKVSNLSGGDIRVLLEMLCQYYLSSLNLQREYGLLTF